MFPLPTPGKLVGGLSGSVRIRLLAERVCQLLPLPWASWPADTGLVGVKAVLILAVG